MSAGQALSASSQAARGSPLAGVAVLAPTCPNPGGVVLGQLNQVLSVAIKSDLAVPGGLQGGHGPGWRGGGLTHPAGAQGGRVRGGPRCTAGAGPQWQQTAWTGWGRRGGGGQLPADLAERQAELEGGGGLEASFVDVLNCIRAHSNPGRLAPLPSWPSGRPRAPEALDCLPGLQCAA